MSFSDQIQYNAKPRIYMCMPNFGPMNPDVAHSWYRPDWAADPRSVSVALRREIRMSSIVGSFSNLWGDALDRRDKGEVDYFTMQHNDIEPEAWWINTLLDEMRTRNAMLISVVSPIKSHDRLLSTNAIGREDDIWHREMISMEQIWAWPPTFAPSQVLKPGEVMMFNTALWLADLRHPAWDDFIFKQYARFVPNEAGERECQLMPEDWELAHFCHARKIPYLITRKVKLKHFGLEFWPNYRESEELSTDELVDSIVSQW